VVIFGGFAGGNACVVPPQHVDFTPEGSRFSPVISHPHHEFDARDFGRSEKMRLKHWENSGRCGDEQVL